MTEKSRPDVAAVWRDRIEAQAASGLTIAEFCKQQPCSVGSFYHWKRRLALGVAQATGRVEMILPGGTIIRLPANDPASLEIVLKHLQHSL